MSESGHKGEYSVENVQNYWCDIVNKMFQAQGTHQKARNSCDLCSMLHVHIKSI